MWALRSTRPRNIRWVSPLHAVAQLLVSDRPDSPFPRYGQLQRWVRRYAVLLASTRTQYELPSRSLVLPCPKPRPRQGPTASSLDT